MNPKEHLLSENDAYPSEMPFEHAVHQIAGEFFREFARMEYALKVAGFNNGDGPAKANWSEFARAIEDWVATPATPEIREAIGYILGAPPKKQFMENGQICWRESQLQTNSQADKLFQYIRCVRNNLFHGGKFNGYWFEPQRSKRLIQSSLVVLRAAVDANSNVSEAYHG